MRKSYYNAGLKSGLSEQYLVKTINSSFESYQYNESPSFKSTTPWKPSPKKSAKKRKI